MLINLSNHPKAQWSEKQITEAERLFGEVFDLPFPAINPLADETDVKQTAEKYFYICVDKINNSSYKNNAVHLMGEFTFVCALVKMLNNKNIKCVVSTTERNTKIINNNKIVKFEFMRFREILVH